MRSRWRALAVSLLLVLTAAACASTAAVPTGVTQTSVIATATPGATATAKPLPTPSALPTAAPAQLVVSVGEQVQAKVAAGTRIDFQPGAFFPLERLTLSYTAPDGSTSKPGFLRADQSGVVTWRRGTGQDALGDWRVDITGDQGTRRVLRYRLEELGLNEAQGHAGADGFQLYETPEGFFHYKPEVHTATAVFVAQLHQQALPLISIDFSSVMKERIAYYMMANGEDLLKEVGVGGAHAVTGYEAGLSLYGFDRSGIYIDTSTSFEGLPHLAAHELTHQFMSRIDPFNRAPTWAIEGFAEYEGNKVATTLQPEQEQFWRRSRRERARLALESGQWADLARFAKYADLLAEKDEKVLDAVYAEAFVLIDYVAQTYGTQALRPLFDQLSVENLELDKPFIDLFGVSFPVFQGKVQAWVKQLEPEEAKVAAFKSYATQFNAIVADTVKVTERWNAFVTGSARMTSGQRKEFLSGLLASNRELEGRLKAIVAPELGKESQGLLLTAYGSFESATTSFLRLEDSRSRTDLEAGNAALHDADYKFLAAQDRLSLQLQANGISGASLAAGAGS